MSGNTTEACTAVAANKENPMINGGHGLLAAAIGEVSHDEHQDVHVRLTSFAELATTTQPLMLDSYQRAYVWTAEKVIQLLEDFAEFIDGESSDSQYYLGTLLFHQKEHQGQSCYCVIDGQQRLTTLAVLYWLLKGTLPDFVQFEFRSSYSLVNVQQAKNTMQEWLKQHLDSYSTLVTLFAQLRFTVITVTREDLAFTFFDTQNNRGVPLGSTDLLKAFHLRAIQSGDLQLVEQLQNHCARKWEQVQQRGELVKKSKRYDFAPDLFHYYLWRARNWRGSDVNELDSRDEMLSHFGEQSRVSKIGQVRLYPGGANQWGRKLELTVSNDYRLTPAVQQFGQQASHLPFSMQQPISRGVGFFLYAEKYANLLQQLLFSPSFEPEINATQQFYKNVVCTLSAYLQSLFRLALLIYFDRLGSQGLMRCALYLDHRFGALRLSKSDVRRETPLKFLREAKRNLLDVISSAYDGDEIINFLQQDNVDGIYVQNDGWQKEILNKGNKVQERYVTAVADYYKLSRLSLKTAQCMDDKVRAELSNSRQDHGLHQSKEDPYGSVFL
ncbi:MULTISPECIES: DUF262 domain-containing protein [Yersinia]|uniref:Uncharacterized conserved protein n=1 Tax=Yersinia frederiksenii TaxID=29484 RepID=A0AAI8ZQ09_YERFR|nr:MULTISPECIES: DUF262 domain-containing protein [Yersinia]MDN0126341.1 DUF262 domain-containing protein [Yersinia massiliensis]CFQ96210.1 Uncharacterized conserved protein [Yersinia frederiksenii]